MPVQPVKFYQVGSFAVGNRLLTQDQRSVQSEPGRTNSLNCGHRACQGCGEALGARYALDAAMRATNRQMVAVNSTGCLEVFSTPYPETSWQIPWMHSLFGNAPAVATGIAAAMRAKGRQDVRVVGQGGDGGTVDIGFACLSGMFERNDDVLFICYDNEAYMNTGVQRSGATPPAARTATTPGRRPRARQRLRPGQERAADRDGTRDPVRRHGDRGRPARPGVQGAARHGVPRRPLPARPGAVPARLGQRVWRHHQDRAARRADRALPGVRGRRRRGRQRDADPQAGAASRSTCGCRPGTRTCSSRPREPRPSPDSSRSPTGTSRGSAC